MLTLQKRLYASFAAALALVLVTGATALYYLHRFDREIHDTLIKDMELAASGEQLGVLLEDLMIVTDAYLLMPDDAKAHEKVIAGFEAFMTGMQQSQAISLVDENIAIHNEILDLGNGLRLQMKGLVAEPERRAAFGVGVRRFFDTAQEGIDTIQRHRREEMAGHRAAIDRLVARAQQNQILIIVTVLIGGIVLTLFMPRRTVWPFRRILQAFNEVWECNLSVRLPTQGGGELAELSRGFNQMMAQLEELDEMKVKRIAFERRRFEVMANSLDMGVLLVSVEGKIIFINAPAFRVFGITSTQVLNRDIESAPLPDHIIELLQEGLATKQRIEGRAWTGTFMTTAGKEVERNVSIDMMPVRTHAGDLVNILMFIEERDTPHHMRLFQKEAHVPAEEG